MYQFTTTNLINSSLDSNGTTAKFAGTSAGLKVTRVGNFLTANILGSISKRSYSVGVKEVAQATIPTVTAGLVIRADINIRLSVQKYSEYASSNSINFNRPVYVEVIASGTPATDATALKDAINAVKNKYGYSEVVATTSSADLIITASDVNQKISSIKIYKEDGYTGNSLVEPKYTDVTSTTFSVTTVGKPGFGDDTWMVSNIVLPTDVNTRFYGISKDERPVIGGNYTQYTLRYQVANSDSDGIVGGGTSITTHVFYVKSDLVLAFEAAIFPTGKNIVEVASGQAFTLTATDDTTAAVFIDISDIAPFVTSASEITATSSVVAKATIGAISIITPTGSPLAQTARIVLTKAAAGATTISVTIDGVTKTKAVTIG